MRLRNEGQIFEEVYLGTTKYSHCKSELKKLKSGGLGKLETNPEGMRQIIKHLSGNGVKILSFGFDVDEETQCKCMKSRDTILVKKKLQLVLMLINNLMKYLKKRIYLNTSTLMMKKRKISLLTFIIQ